MEELRKLKNVLDEKDYAVFQRAHEVSGQLIARSVKCLGELSKTFGWNQSDACFVAVGSVGRYEALGASDLDLIPVFRS